MNYKYIIAAISALLIFVSLSGQNSSETRSFKKTVPIGQASSLELINKYGNVHITPWSKDSAYINVEVIAYASSQAKLKKLFEGIDINISETNHLVRAQTNFTQNINMLFESFKGMTSKIISYDSKVEINYYVSVPEYLNLSIENKYGNVYMENSTGNLKVTASNGSFKANSVGNGASLTLAFCDATINNFSSGKIDASFSEISIGNAGDISISSISSKFDIKTAGNLQIDSRRDKFYTGRLTGIKGDSYFTEYQISRIGREIALSTRYGSLNVDEIEKRFEGININSGYTDITLEFEPGSSYDFDIRHINAFLVLPLKNIRSEQKSINEEKKEYMTYGSFGNGTSTAKVKIDATRGNIYLK